MNTPLIIFWKIPYISRKTRKRHEHLLYVNLEDLTPENKIAIEIALKRQEMLRDSTWFFPLRKLFKKIDYRYSVFKHPHSLNCVSLSEYFEDENEQPLTLSQFMEIKNGLLPMIMTYSGVYVPCEMGEVTARKLGYAELVPIRNKDFEFSEDNIFLLNRFVEDAKKLRHSSLFTQVSPVSLNVSSKCSVKYNISDEQYLASITCFRKLYMQDEPANFYKAVKLLTDARIVHHPVINYMNDNKKKYSMLLSNSLKEDSGIEHTLRFVDINDYPTGRELLDSVLNTKHLHQGDDKTRQAYENLKTMIPDEAIIEFCFYQILQQLASRICYSGDWTYGILHSLNKLSVALPQRRISNAELEFQKYFDDKIVEMAEVIWRSKGCPNTGVNILRLEAKKALEKILNL